MKTMLMILCTALACLAPGSASADVPWQFADDTRYMAMGDSLAAGYGAQPATQGYVYLLYRSGVFDTVPDTLLANVGVPGATSEDVLLHQVPMALHRFRPHVVTITVGGNDLLRILEGADPRVVLANFQGNLVAILGALRAGLPDARIVVGNLYSIAQVPGAEQAVAAFNAIVAGVAAGFDVQVADLFTEFHGREGLLLIDRNGAGALEVHPTNAGYRAIAEAFENAYLQR